MLEQSQMRFGIIGYGRMGKVYSDVYNLSFNNAKPKKISEILQQIIALQPEIIFYGISYSEFYISNENKLFEFFSLFLFKQEKIAYSIIL